MRGKIAFFVAQILTLMNVERTMGNHFGQEINSIYAAFSLPATPPDNVFEEFFASEAVPGHRKNIRTAGGIFNTLSSAPASATVWLTWRDTVDSLITHLSEPINIEVPAGQQVSFNESIIISTSPPLVGIRIRNNGSADPIGASGSVIHQTIPIPEPAGLALAAAGAIALAGAAKRRARSPE